MAAPRYSVGEILAAAKLNLGSDETDANTTSINAHAGRLNTLETPPAASVFHSLAVSIANGILTTLPMNSEEEDTHGGHTTTSRYTIQRAGLYAVCGTVNFASNATGGRFAYLLKNGVVLKVGGTLAAAGPSSVDTRVTTPTRVVRVAVNDYLEMGAWQNSGGALNTLVVDGASAGFSVFWIGA